MQKAKDSLKINDIYLHKLTAECLGDFDPKYDPKLSSYKIQTMHLVEKSQLIQVDDQKTLKVTVSLGVRWFDLEAEEVKAIIEADFIAEYKMTLELTQKEIEAFAKSNVSYHVWPYWRELLSSQASRMHLPKVVLATQQLAQKN